MHQINCWTIDGFISLLRNRQFSGLINNNLAMNMAEKFRRTNNRWWTHRNKLNFNVELLIIWEMGSIHEPIGRPFESGSIQIIGEAW